MTELPRDSAAANRHRRLSEIFHEVAELDPTARDAALDRACAGDTTLREEIAAMLAYDARERGLLDSTLGPPPDEETRAAPSPPERVGSFRLIERIGEGGMGIVYKAEQDEPRRVVAVKLLRAATGDSDAAARFAREVKVLARLDHPNLARVLGSGVARDGLGAALPWFAMEYVGGVPLLDHAKDARLDPRERVDLFLAVVDAVAHAHRNGVIHRDLKSANILVDAAGRPRVLDFGIARLLDDDEEPRRDAMTRPGTVLGTLECLAPEQAEGKPPDTRADVYALGLLLHELLVERPFRSLRGMNWSEAIDRVARAEFDAASLVAVGVDRDLATIVGHALEREPGRRYEGAAELAADLRRFRRSEPILARPQTAWYRLSKLIARHRLAAALSALVVVTFVSGFVATFLAWREAQARAREAALARNAASAVDGYLTRSILLAPDPDRDGREVRVVDLLARASAGLDAAFPDDAVLRASVRETLARSYVALTDFTAAEHEARAALALRESSGAEPAEVLDARAELASALVGQGRFEEALGAARIVAAGRAATLGPEHPETLRARGRVEQCRFELGNREDAANATAALLAISDRVHGADADRSLQLANDLSVMSLALGRIEDAERLARRCLEAHQRAHGPDHRSVWFARGNLAEVLEAAGRLDDAVDQHRELLAGARRLYGDASLGAIRARVGLASALAASRVEEASAEAAQLLREATAIADRVVQRSHPIAIEARRELARRLSVSGEHAEAASLADEVLAALRTRLSGKDHPEIAGALNTRAQVAGRARDFETAERYAAESVAMFRRLTRGDPTPDFAGALFNLGRCLRELGRHADAIPVLEEALAADVRIYGDDHVDVANDRLTLARALVAAGRKNDAKEHLERALPVFVRTLGDDHATTRSVRAMLESAEMR